jgi:nucleoid DNA-binding protein
MATKKKTKKKTAKKGGKCLKGFRKTGKNATRDGVSITFDKLVHDVQDDMVKKAYTKPSLELIRNIAYMIGWNIADNLAKGDKVCVSIPDFGSFKTSVRTYNVAGKKGKTKTVKFTPSGVFKDSAKLGAK